jgi:hypothetical protein
MYLLQQLVALISEDAPHEYADRPSLVELVVDEDKHFCSVGDALGFRLIERELPLYKPLEDGEAPIGIFEVHFWCLIDRHDLGLRLLRWPLAFFLYGRLMLTTCENTVGNQCQCFRPATY